MNYESVGRSKEDYLAAILFQLNTNGACRPTDVATRLGYSKASVSVAFKKLEEEGLIIRDDWRILLTERGRTIAENMKNKHDFFMKWFELIGINEKIAIEEACQLEHIISDDSFYKIVDYLKEKDSRVN